MDSFKKHNLLSAFTLLELLVVIVIIGLLAAVAIPSFREAIEEAYIKEARSVLGSVRAAEKLYKARVGNYVGVDIIAADKTPEWGLLGIEVEDTDDWKYGVEILDVKGGCNTAGTPNYGNDTDNVSCVPFAYRITGPQTTFVMHIQMSNGEIRGSTANPAPGQLRATLNAAQLDCVTSAQR